MRRGLFKYETREKLACLEIWVRESGKIAIASRPRSRAEKRNRATKARFACEMRIAPSHQHADESCQLDGETVLVILLTHRTGAPLPHLPSPTVATMTSTSVATVELEDNIDAQRVGKFMCVVPPKVRSTRAIENLSRQLSAAPHLRLERRATRGPSRANYATGNDFRAHLFHLRHASPPRRLQHRRSA